jgi:mono/diheme cytochrome c family protein/rhodanese-related sulfurtransferase/catechol 2,3-dioxygenase-like lactoylglutathione lyase family enzyme
MPISNRLRLTISFFVFILFIGFMNSCDTDPIKDISDDHPLMGSGYGISDVALIVNDLDSTLKYYTDVLGFAPPMFGGVDTGLLKGTISTAIAFPDMSSLVIISPEDSTIHSEDELFVPAVLNQLKEVRMYSLSSSSAKATHAWLDSIGFQVDTIKSRQMFAPPPGASGWDTEGFQSLIVNFEGENGSAHLPGFMKFSAFPYEKMHEWNSFYNFQRGSFKHPNGVVGITSIALVSNDHENVRNELKKMGLVEVEFNRSEKFSRFKLKRNQELIVRSPLSENDDYAAFLNDRGPGLFAINFEVENLQSTTDTLTLKLADDALFYDTISNKLIISRDYALGIQLEFEQEPEQQGMMAAKLNMNFSSSLDSIAAENAENLYLKYCALCHGKNREGYAADNAPSLRSHSLLATSQGSNFLRYTIQYGRTNTAMAGYYKEVGGPLDFIEIELLLKWLNESSGIEEPIKLSREPVIGDVELGSEIYTKKCASCHGLEGEGISAPALGGGMLLATATDGFLRYAISEGRDSTPMPAFKDTLTELEIDAVTAFIRSRASGWSVPVSDTVKIPTPEEYVLNPDSEEPDFNLRDDLYLSAEQLNRALQDSVRFILLDARSEVAWRQTHIPGAIPVPYYKEPEEFIEDIPDDGTWIIAYCACPHAASGKVISTLRRYGYKNTGILDEGILVWTELGYPVQHGH